MNGDKNSIPAEKLIAALARPIFASLLDEATLSFAGGSADAADLAFYASGVGRREDAGAGSDIAGYAIFDIAFRLGFNSAVSLTRDPFSDIHEFIEKAKRTAESDRKSYAEERELESAKRGKVA